MEKKMKMTHLAFIKCMKYLNACYSKNMDQEQLESWFEYFSDVSYSTLNNAIKEIVSESKYFPTISQLKDKCKEVNKKYIVSIIDKMKESGYFKKGVEELTDSHALRNYEKTLMWLDEGNLPEFVETDIKEFLKQNKQIEQKDKKLLSNAKKL